MITNEPSEPTPPQSAQNDPASDPGRREFLKAAACGVLGSVAVLAPVAAGTIVLTAPLRRGSAGGVFVKLTNLGALPIGSPPQLFQVLIERNDAWTKHPLTAVGAVFLERLSEREIRAFHSACPHLGCAVEWRGDRDSFYCPCHNSTFARDGSINDPNSPSARGLDTLDVELRADDEVWVKFENFKAAIAEKVPVA